MVLSFRHVPFFLTSCSVVTTHRKKIVKYFNIPTYKNLYIHLPTAVCTERKTMGKKNSDEPKQTVIIGLDGSTWDNLGQWIKNGDLPFFGELLKNGVRATLNTTIPTLYTGMNPGEHGILKFTKPNGDLVNMSDVSYPKIWNILDSHNLRSLVCNVRVTYPSEPLNGIFFPGNPHPPGVENSAYPLEMSEKYKEFSSRKLYDQLVSFYDNIPFNKERILNANIQISQSKFKIFMELIKKENFDFIFYWNGRSDGTMHMLWNYPELVLKLYQHLEELLQDFYSCLPEANIIILSDHGHHQASTLRFHVNNYLEQQGFLVRTGGRFHRKAIDLISGLGRNYIPSWLVEWVLNKRKEKDQIRAENKEKGLENKNYSNEKKLYSKSLTNHPGIDYKKSKAVQRELWGIDLLNYKNREEYERLAEDLISALYEAKHESEPIVNFATKKRDFYMGKYIDDIPDIIFLTHGKFIAEYELSSKIISKPRGKSKMKKYGEHKNARKGIFLATGPDIQKGIDIGEMDIVDVLPTVLQLLKKPVPRYLNGRVLTDIFRKPVEVSISEKTPERYLPSLEKRELSPEEKEEMKERFRSLGYFDEV